MKAWKDDLLIFVPYLVAFNLVIIQQINTQYQDVIISVRTELDMSNFQLNIFLVLIGTVFAVVIYLVNYLILTTGLSLVNLSGEVNQQVKYSLLLGDTLVSVATLFIQEYIDLSSELTIILNSVLGLLFFAGLLYRREMSKKSFFTAVIIRGALYMVNSIWVLLK